MWRFSNYFLLQNGDLESMEETHYTPCLDQLAGL